MKRPLGTQRLLQSTSSRRGNARVMLPALIAGWMVAVIGLFMWFSTNSDKAAISEQLATRTSERDNLQAEMEGERGERASEVVPVGFVEDENAVYKTVSPDAISNRIDEVRRIANLPAGTETPTLESLFQPLLDRISAEQSAKEVAEGEAANLRTQLDTERNSKRTIQSDLEGEKRELETRIADVEQAAEDAQNELEDQVERLRDNVNDLDAQNRELRNEISALERAALQANREHVARVNNMKERLRDFAEPHASQPDGEIVSTSEELPLAWIDLGTQNRLAVGTSFDVYDGDPGTPRMKGRCMVTRTERNRAEVEITETVDRFDPIVAGDILINPLYDPNAERNAVMLGRFDGLFSQSDLEVLLGEIGITVQPGLDQATDFLIVGGELYVDEEGEPLEEPIQPSEMSAYRDAEAQGCVIVPISDMRRYFRM